METVVQIAAVCLAAAVLGAVLRQARISGV